MAISIVQTKSVSGGASVGDKTIAFTSNITSGNAIVLCTIISNSSGSISYSDTQSNSYTSLSSQTNAGDFLVYQISIVKSATAGATTITAAGTASLSYAIMAYEISGLNTTQPHEGTTAYLRDGDFVSPALTNTQSYGGANGIAIAWYANNGNSGAYTLGSGWSTLVAPATATGVCVGSESKAVTGAGSTSATIDYTHNGITSGILTVLSDTLVSNVSPSASASPSLSPSSSVSPSASRSPSSSVSASISPSASTSPSSSVSRSLSPSSSTSPSPSVSPSSSASASLSPSSSISPSISPSSSQSPSSSISSSPSPSPNSPSSSQSPSASRSPSASISPSSSVSLSQSPSASSSPSSSNSPSKSPSSSSSPSASDSPSVSLSPSPSSSSSPSPSPAFEATLDQITAIRKVDEITITKQPTIDITIID